MDGEFEMDSGPWPPLSASQLQCGLEAHPGSSLHLPRWLLGLVPIYNCVIMEKHTQAALPEETHSPIFRPAGPWSCVLLRSVCPGIQEKILGAQWSCNLEEFGDGNERSEVSTQRDHNPGRQGDWGGGVNVPGDGNKDSKVPLLSSDPKLEHV